MGPSAIQRTAANRIDGVTRLSVRTPAVCRLFPLGEALPSTASAGSYLRIIKTMHLLNFFNDEAYRRRILVQLNRGEGRHMLARAIFHGKRGELRQRYRQGQEDQLGALGLIVNAVVLWNTIYMDAALSQLRNEGLKFLDEDVARLSRASGS